MLCVHIRLSDDIKCYLAYFQCLQRYSVMFGHPTRFSWKSHCSSLHCSSDYVNITLSHEVAELF